MSHRIDSAGITRRRITEPGAIEALWASRRRGAVPPDGRLLLIAADHPARGALSVRGRMSAMSSRSDLLDRIALALSRPGVDGSPRHRRRPRGPAPLRAARRQGRHRVDEPRRPAGRGVRARRPVHGIRHPDPGRARVSTGARCCTRICLDDPGTVRTLEHCGRAVTELAGAWPHGPGRAVPRRASLADPGREPPRPRLRHHLGRRRSGPRRDEQPNVAQAARRPRDGPGPGHHHAADADARGRPARRPAPDAYATWGRRWPTRRPPDWSSDVPCSTHLTTTSQPPSISLPTSCTEAPMSSLVPPRSVDRRRRLRRAHRSRRSRLVAHRPVCRGPAAGRVPDGPDRRLRMDRASALGRGRQRSRPPRRPSPSRAAPTCSPARPTSSMCPGTRPSQ